LLLLAKREKKRTSLKKEGGETGTHLSSRIVKKVGAFTLLDPRRDVLTHKAIKRGTGFGGKKSTSSRKKEKKKKKKKKKKKRIIGGGL